MTYDSRELNMHLSKSIASTIIDAIVSDLHSDVHKVMNERSENDIYDELKEMGYSVDRNNDGIKKIFANNTELEVSIALKFFLKKVIDNYSREHDITIKQKIEKQIRNLKLKSTKNPKFMESEDGKFYILENNIFICQKNIISVNSDGTYIAKEAVKNSPDKFLIVHYDINNKAIALKLTNRNNVTYKSKEYVANCLKLKQEFVKRFKLSGYCGNSSDIIGSIANMLFAPIASGYYIDEKYNIYKWNPMSDQFEKEMRFGLRPGAPLIADYEVKDKIVIRTDYDGKGLR